MLEELKNNISDNADRPTSLSFLADAVDKRNKVMEDIKKELKRIKTENVLLKH